MKIIVDTVALIDWSDAVDRNKISDDFFFSVGIQSIKQFNLKKSSWYNGALKLVADMIDLQVADYSYRDSIDLSIFYKDYNIKGKHKEVGNIGIQILVDKVDGARKYLSYLQPETDKLLEMARDAKVLEPHHKDYVRANLAGDLLYYFTRRSEIVSEYFMNIIRETFISVLLRQVWAISLLCIIFVVLAIAVVSVWFQIRKIYKLIFNFKVGLQLTLERSFCLREQTMG